MPMTVVLTIVAHEADTDLYFWQLLPFFHFVGHKEKKKKSLDLDRDLGRGESHVL